MRPGEIYVGDAMAGLATLAPGSVHAVITDPPYSSGGQFRGDRSGSTDKKYTSTDAKRHFADFDGDTRDQRSFAFWLTMILTAARKATVPGGACATFVDWRQLATVTDVFQAAGWVFRGIAVWSKPSARPMLGRPTNACEYVVWGTNGARPIAGEALPGHWHISAPRDREHPTQKPIEVMRSLVRLAPAGGVVLDPFLGSGTTAVAAEAEGRLWMGCESSEHYADIARSRIAKQATVAA